MFNCLCINDLFALQRYKNFWTFLLFPLCFKALSTIYLQVGNFSKFTIDFNFSCIQRQVAMPQGSSRPCREKIQLLATSYLEDCLCL